MKERLACLLPVVAVLVISSVAARADQFSRIENSPDIYWVPAPTPPPPDYAAAQPPPYYGPAPYYGPPPPPRVHFFLGFHFH
jgi:hypothetical protein